jgi:membrane protein YdbS with pleckstrin-like domain
MYNAFRQTCERLLRIPRDPAPPPGDEASTRIFRAAPNYYKYLLLLWALRSAALLFVVVFVLLISIVVPALPGAKRGHPEMWLLLLLPLFVGAFVLLDCLLRLAVLRLQYEKRWYVVTDRSLRVREGVVTVREMTVNFANIQNIAISEGPIQRALGIADLRVETAGGGGASSQHNRHQPMENLHSAWFRGINNASEVRELIQQRLRLLKDSGLGDHEELSRPGPARGPVTGVAASGALLAALHGVHAEAQALRQAAEGVGAERGGTSSGN